MRFNVWVVAAFAVLILTLPPQLGSWTHFDAANGYHLESEYESRRTSPSFSHLDAVQHPVVDPSVLGGAMVRDIDSIQNGDVLSCGWFYDEVSFGGTVYQSELKSNGYPSTDGFITIEHTTGLMDVFIINGSGNLKVAECEGDGNGGVFFIFGADNFFGHLYLNGTPVYPVNGGWIGHMTANGTVDLLIRGGGMDMIRSQNGIIIVGGFGGNISFGSWNLTANTFQDVYVAELGLNGTWNWAASAGGHYTTEVAFGVTENDDHVFVTGAYCMYSSSGECEIDFGAFSITSVGYDDIFVAALNKSTIQWDWARSAGSSGYDDGKAIELGDDGHLYLGGFYGGSISMGSTTLSHAGNIDAFIASMDTNGTWRWALGGGGVGVENVEDIAVFNQTVVIAGSHCTMQSSCSSTFGSSTVTSNGYSDVLVASATTSGSWIQAIGGGGSVSSYEADKAMAVTHSSDSHLIVAGFFRTSATFGTTSLNTYNGQYGGFIWTLFEDSDADGIADGDDNCPTVANPSQWDHDGDGQGDACDDDDDGDGIPDDSDYCELGLLNWTSNQTTDYDSDGCEDSSEDSDDDSDGVPDLPDKCERGLLNWSSNETTDNDRDGCHDDVEDEDDDNDSYLDDEDKCSRGEINWVPDSINDHDSDGCMDSTEDEDDDNDGISDGPDICPRGMLNWESNQSTDFDSDGCQDSDEDVDDDNDTILDPADACPTGSHGWVSTPETDHDRDGCRDFDDDDDDDDDGVLDEVDRCASGETGWSSNATNDHDEDGCRDSDEDMDDDDDGIMDGMDDCPKGLIGWTSSNETDLDGDGCRDHDEDEDDDGDGVVDEDDACPTDHLPWSSTDLNDHDGDGCEDAVNDDDDDDDLVLDFEDRCPLGAYNWTSNASTDHDGDGCNDAFEDEDDDDDGMNDTEDRCPRGSASWVSNATSDHDADGCLDSGEDLDDDNDGIRDNLDGCPLGLTNWTSNATTDFDRDGCEDEEEDDDDDGDGVLDDVDGCLKSEIGWVSNSHDDADGDGCVDDAQGVFGWITSPQVSTPSILVIASVVLFLFIRWRKS